MHLQEVRTEKGLPIRTTGSKMGLLLGSGNVINY